MSYLCTTFRSERALETFEVFLKKDLESPKKGFTFAPLSAPKTGGEVLKKLRKKFFKNLVDSKKGFTFATAFRFEK